MHRLLRLELVLAVGLSLFGVAGCGQPAIPSSSAEEVVLQEADRYMDRDLGFSLILPHDWRQVALGSTAVAAVAPDVVPADTMPASVNVVIDDLSQPVSLEAYTFGARTRAGQTLKDFFIEERGVTKIGSERAQWQISTFTTPHGPVRAATYVLVTSQRAYVITCGSAPERFAAYRSLCDAVARSFRLVTRD